ncbi:hypothetical protein BYT27DRAFT_7195637 [Phlegmacium glaucopus]|nr:hypothetical protein BYT27DRAFT_7195637 [Phlegmacium glaucopus]
MELHWQTAHLHAQYVCNGSAQMLSATFELLYGCLIFGACRVIEFSLSSVCLLRPQLVDAKSMHKTFPPLIFTKTLFHYDIMVFITQSMAL